MQYPRFCSGKILGSRLALAAVAVLATASMYAEGVLKNGWIEAALLTLVVWFTALTKRTLCFKNFLLLHSLIPPFTPMNLLSKMPRASLLWDAGNRT